MKPYLDIVKNNKYRKTIARFRSSSHALEIERGRHTKPKTPLDKRVCAKCKTLESEVHFVMYCTVNFEERLEFFEKILNIFSPFGILSDTEKFKFIFANNDPRCLSWLGKFLHTSFETRNNCI